MVSCVSGPIVSFVEREIERVLSNPNPVLSSDPKVYVWRGPGGYLTLTIDKHVCV